MPPKGAMSFVVTDRPDVGTSPRPRGAFQLALLETLTSGQAISVPLNGESIKKIRCRYLTRGFYLAVKIHARFRTAQSLDKQSVLFWLEQKEVE